MRQRGLRRRHGPGHDPATIYGPDILRRLVSVKRAWDPDNVFRMNHNIRP